MWQELLQLSSGEEGTPFQFSTEEQKTNLKWINGEDIYIKVYTGTKKSSSIINVGTIPSDASQILGIEPHENNNDGSSIGQYYASENDKMRCYKSGKDIRLESSNNNTNYIVYLIYTKN